jgi:hypothetical protein
LSIEICEQDRETSIYNSSERNAVRSLHLKRRERSPYSGLVDGDGVPKTPNSGSEDIGRGWEVS